MTPDERQRLHTVFKLDGKSRDHALRVCAFLDARSEKTNLPAEDVRASYLALGAASPVVRIKHFFEGHPRAYAAVPMVCLHPFHNDQFYMYAPIGYNGDVFRPEDALELSEKEAETVGHGLFAGGWCDPAYVILPRDRGTELPADYKPETSFHYTFNSGIAQPDRRYVFFKPVREETISSLLDSKDRLVALFNAAGQVVETRMASPAAIPDWIDKALGFNLRAPIIRDFAQGPVLAYRCDDPDSLTFCPEGFERMSSAEFQWLDADIGDMNLGIVPPPHPQHLLTHTSKGSSCTPLPA